MSERIDEVKLAELERLTLCNDTSVTASTACGLWEQWTTLAWQLLPRLLAERRATARAVEALRDVQEWLRGMNKKTPRSSLIAGAKIVHAEVSAVLAALDGCKRQETKP